MLAVSGIVVLVTMYVPLLPKMLAFALAALVKSEVVWHAHFTVYK
jgi:hypothetical protein